MELRYHWKKESKEWWNKDKWDIEEWEIVRIVSCCLRSEKEDNELHIYLWEDDSDIGRQECSESVAIKMIAFSDISLRWNSLEIDPIVASIGKIEWENKPDPHTSYPCPHIGLYTSLSDNKEYERGEACGYEFHEIGSLL